MKKQESQNPKECSDSDEEFVSDEEVTVEELPQPKNGKDFINNINAVYNNREKNRKKNNNKPRNTSFEVLGHTPIGFGKLKGQPHSALLLKENNKYAKWVVDQGPEFRYNSTRSWLINALERKSLTKAQFQAIQKKTLYDCSLDEIDQYVEHIRKFRKKSQKF